MPDSTTSGTFVFRRWMLPIPLLLLAPFVLPIPEALDKIYILRIVGSLCHFGLPGLLLVFFYKVAGARGRIVRAALLAFLLAAGAELAQSHVGRHPRFIDAGIDLSGILFATGLLMHREGRPRRVTWPLLLFLVVLPWLFLKIPENLVARYHAARRFPVIADFEDRTDEVLWDLSREGDGRFWYADRSGGDSRVICLSGGPQDQWPGITMRGMPRDWSGWDTLAFDALIVVGSPVHLAVRIEDFHGTKDKTWCFTHVKLDRGWRTYEIDLRELVAGLEGRDFRLDDVSLLVLYLVGARTETTVAIDNMILERGTPQTGGE